MSTVTITISKGRGLRRSQYRWTASTKNSRKLAHGGEGYNNKDDLMHALHILYGPKLSGHNVVDTT